MTGRGVELVPRIPSVRARARGKDALAGVFGGIGGCGGHRRAGCHARRRGRPAARAAGRRPPAAGPGPPPPSPGLVGSRPKMRKMPAASGVQSSSQPAPALRGGAGGGRRRGGAPAGRQERRRAGPCRLGRCGASLIVGRAARRAAAVFSSPLRRTSAVLARHRRRPGPRDRGRFRRSSRARRRCRGVVVARKVSAQPVIGLAGAPTAIRRGPLRP